MKATSIVRRVYDLRRIMIPKEIRRTIHLKEGDMLLKTLGTYGRWEYCSTAWGLHHAARTAFEDSFHINLRIDPEITMWDTLLLAGDT